MNQIHNSLLEHILFYSHFKRERSELLFFILECNSQRNLISGYLPTPWSSCSLRSNISKIYFFTLFPFDILLMIFLKKCAKLEIAKVRRRRKILPFPCLFISPEVVEFAWYFFHSNFCEELAILECKWMMKKRTRGGPCCLFARCPVSKRPA